MSDEKTPKRSVAELEAEVLRTRAEMVDTADTLASRLSPRNQATEAREAASKVWLDAVGTDPEADAENRTRARLILAGSALALVSVVARVVRRIRRGR